MNIIQNAIKITENKNITYLVSSHVHDFKTYTFKDGKEISIDGGRNYIKRAGDILNINHNQFLETPDSKYVEWSLDDSQDFDLIKNRLLWGTYGKNGEKVLTYKLIKDLELDHLKNIIKENNKKNNDSSKCVFNLSKIHKKVIKYWIKYKEKEKGKKSYISKDYNYYIGIKE